MLKRRKRNTLEGIWSSSLVQPKESMFEGTVSLTHSFFPPFLSLSLSLSSFKPFLISDPHLSTKWDISDLNPSRPDQIGSPRLDGARQKSASEARRWVWPGWA